MSLKRRQRPLHAVKVMVELLPVSELSESNLSSRVKKRQCNELIFNELTVGSCTKSYCFPVVPNAHFLAFLCVPILGFRGTHKLAQFLQWLHMAAEE